MVASSALPSQFLSPVHSSKTIFTNHQTRTNTQDDCYRCGADQESAVGAAAHSADTELKWKGKYSEHMHGMQEVYDIMRDQWLDCRLRLDDPKAPAEWCQRKLSILLGMVRLSQPNGGLGKSRRSRLFNLQTRPKTYIMPEISDAPRRDGKCFHANPSARSMGKQAGTRSLFSWTTVKNGVVYSLKTWIMVMGQSHLKTKWSARKTVFTFMTQTTTQVMLKDGIPTGRLFGLHPTKILCFETMCEKRR
jgi:hypothetical protein